MSYGRTHREKSAETKQGTKSQRARNAPSIRDGASPVRSLQRTLGNRAVQELFDSGEAKPKLAVGSPGDRYEREADRVAETVMRMPTSATDGRSTSDDSADAVRGQGRSDAQASGGGTTSQIRSLRGGRRLPSDVRSDFEGHVGHDFGGVRIHTGERADAAARAIRARAFTVGTDVAFRSGEYAPTTPPGRRLMAHELTHVVQGSESGDGTTIRRQKTETEGGGGQEARIESGRSQPSWILAGTASNLQLQLDPELREAIANAGSPIDQGRTEQDPLPPVDLDALLPTLPPASGLESPHGLLGPHSPGTDPVEGTAGGTADRSLDSQLASFVGLDTLRSVYYGGVNPNRTGSAIRSTSETQFGDYLSAISERELAIPERSIFGEQTSGLRFENYSGFELSFGDYELELGQNTVTATGQLGDLETQNIGRVRLKLGPAEIVYRNDHDFFELIGLGSLPTLMGGGTDQGLTAAADLNFDLVDLDLDPELFDDVYLEQVGLSLELNTGEPLQYGATADELPVYDRERIRHPGVDRGEFTVSSLFRHRPSDVAVSVAAGVNSSRGRDKVQGDIVHDPLNIPRFPVTPYLEFTVNVGVSVPF